MSLFTSDVFTDSITQFIFAANKSGNKVWASHKAGATIVACAVTLGV